MNLKPIQPKRKSMQGKWVERPRRSEISLCSCGNKYIKSRDRQKMCLRCIGELSRAGK